MDADSRRAALVFFGIVALIAVPFAWWRAREALRPVLVEARVVTATSGEGEVYAHAWTTRDGEEAEGWLREIEAKVAGEPGWDPRGREAWSHWRDLYGSDAYVRNEADLVARERMDELF